MAQMIIDYKYAKAIKNKELEKYNLVKIANFLKSKGYTAEDIERIRKAKSPH